MDILIGYRMKFHSTPVSVNLILDIVIKINGK